MQEEYRIEIFFNEGQTFGTTVPENEKDKIIECLADREIEQISFEPDKEKNETYIVNLKNINLVKISEIKKVRN